MGSITFSCGILLVLTVCFANQGIFAQDDDKEDGSNLWPVVRKVLGNQKTVTLNNGQTVQIQYIHKFLQSILKGKALADLSSDDKALLEFLYTELVDAGYSFSVNGRKISSWEELFQYIQVESGSQESEKNVNVFQIVMKVLGKKKVLELDNGEEVKLVVIRKLLNQIKQGKKLNELDEEEQEILEALFTLLKSEGYTFQVNGSPVESWQELFQYIVISSAKSNKKTYRGIEAVWKVIQQVLTGKDLAVEGESFTLDFVYELLIKLVKGKSVRELSDKEKGVLQFVYSELEKAGYQLQVNGKKITSWLQLVELIKDSKQTKPEKRAWNIIWKILDKQEQKNEPVTLEDGQTVSWTYIISLLKEISQGEKSEISSQDEEALRIVFSILKDRGIKIPSPDGSTNGGSTLTFDEFLVFVKGEDDSETDTESPDDETSYSSTDYEFVDVTTESTEQPSEAVSGTVRQIIQLIATYTIDEVNRATVEYEQDGVTYKVPLICVTQELKLAEEPDSGKFDTSDVSNDEFMGALYACSQPEPTTSDETSEETSEETSVTIEYIIKFISQYTVDQLQNAKIQYTKDGQTYNIPIIFIINELGLEVNSETGKYDISDVNPEELQIVLDNYITELSSSTVFQSTTTPSRSVTGTISQIIQLISTYKKDQVDVAIVQYTKDGVTNNVPLICVTKNLELVEDPDTEKYDTSGVTDQEFLDALYQCSEPEITSTTTELPTEISFEQILETISEYPADQLEDITVQYKKDGQTYIILLIEIIKALGLQINPQTNRYDTTDITLVELEKTLDDVITQTTTQQSHDENISRTVSQIILLISTYTTEQVDRAVVEYTKDGVTNRVPLNCVIKNLGLEADPETDKYDTSGVTDQEFLDALNQCSEPETTSTTTELPTEISFEQILETISEYPADQLEDITVQYEKDGQTYIILLIEIIKALGLQINPQTNRYDTTDITLEELENTLDDVITQTTTQQSHDENISRTVSQIILLISTYTKDQVDRAVVEYTKDGVTNRVPLNCVIKNLGLEADPETDKYDTSGVTDQEFLDALNQCSEPQVIETTTSKQPLDENVSSTVSQIILLISTYTTDQVNRAVVEYTKDGVTNRVLLNCVIKNLGLEADPETDKYDTSGVTDQEFLDALNQCSEPETTSTTTELPTEISFEQILETISEYPADQLEDITVQYEKDGQTYIILLIEIIKALGLQINPQTNRYDTTDITLEELENTLDDVIIQTTTQQSHDENISRTVSQIILLISTYTTEQVDRAVVEYTKDGVTNRVPLNCVIKNLGLEADPETDKYDTSGVTDQEFLDALNQCSEPQVIETTTSKQPLDENVSSTVSQIILLISTYTTDQVDRAVVQYTKNGVTNRVPLNCVIKNLGLEEDPETGKYDTAGVTEQEFLDALNQCSEPEAPETTTSKQPLDENVSSTVSQIILLISTYTTEQVDRAVVQYTKNGVTNRVPLNCVIKNLGLEEDPETGKYDTAGVTEQEFLDALNQCSEPEAAEVTTSKQPLDENVSSTVSQIILLISTYTTDQVDRAVVQYTKNGVTNRVPLNCVIKNLGLEEDPETGKYDTAGVTDQEFLDALNQCSEPEESEEYTATTISEVDDESKVEYILNLIRKGFDNVKGNINIFGKDISLEFIVTILKRLNIKPGTVSEEELGYIINMYVTSGSEFGRIGLRSDDLGVLQQVINFIDKYGQRGRGEVILNGYKMELSDIIKILLLKHVPLNRVTVEDLWVIIKNMGDLQRISNIKKSEEREIVYLYFKKILEDHINNIENIWFIYDDITIPLEQLLIKLGVQKDADGSYLIDTVDANTLWDILQEYGSQKITGDPEVDAAIRQVYEIFKDYVTAASKYIVVRNKRIPVKEIISRYNIKLNDQTLDYIKSLDPKEIWKVLLSFVQSNEDDGQKNQLYEYFLTLIADPKKVRTSLLKVNGVQVKLQDVIDALGLKIDDGTGKYDVSQLTADSLWDVLMKIVKNGGL